MRFLIAIIIYGLLAWITQIGMVVLKLTGNLDWHWALILTPLIASIALIPCAWFGFIAYILKEIAEEDD